MRLNIVASFLVAILLVIGASSKAGAQDWRWHKWATSHCSDTASGKCCDYYRYAHPRRYARYMYWEQCAKECGKECTHDKDSKDAKKCGDSCHWHHWHRCWQRNDWEDNNPFYNDRYYYRGAGR